MTLSVIAAVSRNGVIGVNGEIPWRIPFDMRIFKEWTMGKMLICGRKTFESMGSKVLPGRGMVVLTSQKGVIPHTGIQPQQATSLKSALQLAENSIYDDAVVIGGEAVYKEALPLCSDLLITWVMMTVGYTSPLEDKGGIARFPMRDINFEEMGAASVYNEYEGDGANIGFTFIHYKKKEPENGRKP